MFVQYFWSFAVVVVGLGCRNAYAEMTPEQAEVHKYVMECAEEYGFSEQEIMEMHKKHNAADVEPCLVSCFLKKIGIFTSNGMYDVDKAMARTEPHNNEEMKKIMKECASVNDVEVSDGDKGCERAKLLSKCFMDHKNQLDLKD